MPKPKNPKLAINLDLLRPQSNPEKIYIKLLRWLLSIGRYIFIFVEALVLLAFIARFKLDADLAAKKEAIEQQIPFIEALKPYEILIRQTQLKLTTIRSFRSVYANYPLALKKIADQTPLGVKITSLNLEGGVAQIVIHLSGQAKNNTDLANFLAALKQDQFFKDINITSVGFEKGTLNFSLSFSAKSAEGKKS